MIYIWDIKTGYSTRSGKYKTLEEYEFISKNITNKNLKILDIGGGSGRFAIPLQQAGHKITVIEPNKDALQLLRARTTKLKSLIVT